MKEINNMEAERDVARACVVEGEIGRATKIYRDLIERFPSDYLSYKEIEKLYIKSGHPQKAIALWKSLAPDHPLKRKSYKRLTGIYWRLGDVSRAIACLRKEIKEYGPTPKACRELAKFYMIQKNFVKAIEYFQNALAQDRGDWEARTWLGVALMEDSNYELAEYEFSKLLSERPRDFQALIHMAELRIRQNRLEEARRMLDEIESRYPDNSRVKLCRAEVDYLEGRFKDAVQRGEAALAATPFYYIWEQVRCHRLLKHAYKALRDARSSSLHLEMQEALRRHRDPFSALIRVAELKIGNGIVDEGKEILERVLELYPGNPRALVALAEAHLIDGEVAEAADIAGSALGDIAPPFAIEKVRAHAVLAMAFSRLGKREMAAAHRRQRDLLRSRVRPA